MKPFAVAAVALAAVIATQACTPVGVAVGVGATAGLAAAQERGIEGVSRDVALKAKIVAKLIDRDSELFAKVSVDVYERRALLTGIVADDARRAEAVSLAWKVDGVTDVLNEIEVANSPNLLDFSHDAWITAKISAGLTFDEDVDAINYSVTTSNKVVYLMGIARNRTELDKVVVRARGTDYVRRVVSHVRLKDAPVTPTS